MRLSVAESIMFEHRSEELVIEAKHLIEQLTILDVIGLGAMVPPSGEV